MKSDEEAVRILNEAKAVVTNDHFVYTSEKHGSVYVDKDAIYPFPNKVNKLCQKIAYHFDTISADVEVVVGPAMGGIILSQWTAWNLGQFVNRGTSPLAIYAEKEGDGFVFRGAYRKLISGMNVLIVEDILTTGGSVKKVIEAVRALGGKIVGVGDICNRGGVTTEDVGGVPEIYSLLNLSLEAWEEKDCPLCQQGVPINQELGHGKEFLVRKAALSV